MGIQYKPTKQNKEKPVKAPKAPKAEKAMKLGTVATVKPTKAQKPPKPEKAPKMAKAMKFESQKPMQIGKVQDSAKSGSGALHKPVNPKVMVAVFAVVIVVLIAAVVGVFFVGGGIFVDDTPAVKPESMTITALPEKTLYYVGEVPVFSGLKLAMTLSNGATVTLDGSECEITGFDSSTPSDSQTITVKYNDIQTTFTVVIREIPGTITGQFIGLSFKSMPKTEYKVGDYLSVDGGVLLLHYDDGSTKEAMLDYYHIEGFTSKEPGTYTLTVKYVEDGFLAQTTYTITVTE